MKATLADPRAHTPYPVDVEGVAPPLATIAQLDPALARTLAVRVDTSAYTRANVPARIFGAHARAALSDNDFARFAAIAEGNERLAIERVGRRANTAALLVGAAVAMGFTLVAAPELGVGATAAIEVTLAASAAALTRTLRRFHGANSEAIARAMTDTLARLPAADTHSRPL